MNSATPTAKGTAMLRAMAAASKVPNTVVPANCQVLSAREGDLLGDLRPEPDEHVARREQQEDEDRRQQDEDTDSRGSHDTSEDPVAGTCAWRKANGRNGV